MDIEIISGFLGAGKTTFLNQYIPLLKGRTVVIENEFGDIGLDGQMIESDIPVREINAGCICCSLALDFRQEIKLIAEQFAPDRILIEPSGVGRLTDIVKACQKAGEKDGIEIQRIRRIALVDVAGFTDYADGFGEFYLDQIKEAEVLFYSNLEQLSSDMLKAVTTQIRSLNPEAVIYKEDWRQLAGEDLLKLLGSATQKQYRLVGNSNSGRPADQVFSSLALTDIPVMKKTAVEDLISKIASGEFGEIIRIKGVIPTVDQQMLQINYTPAYNRITAAAYSLDVGLIIIGSKLKEEAIKNLL